MGCLAAGRSAPYVDRRGRSIPEGAPWKVVHGRGFSMVLHQYGGPIPDPLTNWRLTNNHSGLPQWEKNWLSASEKLWYDRWIHMLELRPEFVQIITCRCLQLTQCTHSWLTGPLSHPQGTTMANPATSTTPSARVRLSQVPSTMSTTCAHTPHLEPFFLIS